MSPSRAPHLLTLPSQLGSAGPESSTGTLHLLRLKTNLTRRLLLTKGCTQNIA